jgi:hypothetical protein
MQRTILVAIQGSSDRASALQACENSSTASALKQKLADDPIDGTGTDCRLEAQALGNRDQERAANSLSSSASERLSGFGLIGGTSAFLC